MEGWRAVRSSAWWHLQLCKVFGFLLKANWNHESMWTGVAPTWEDGQEGQWGGTRHRARTRLFLLVLMPIFFFSEKYAHRCSRKHTWCSRLQRKKTDRWQEGRSSLDVHSRHKTIFRAVRTLKPHLRQLNLIVRRTPGLEEVPEMKGPAGNCFWEPGAPLHLPLHIGGCASVSGQTPPVNFILFCLQFCPLNFLPRIRPNLKKRKETCLLLNVESWTHALDLAQTYR